MAFQILNEEEVSLLTAGQREHYEKKLQAYQQRERLVEKITELENAEIKPYQSNLKPIDIIGEIEIAPFTRPERKGLNLKLVQKPELKHGLVGKVNKKVSVSEVMQSNFVRKERVSLDQRLLFKAGHFRNHEQKRCVLPVLSKPAIPNVTFNKFGNVPADPVRTKKPAVRKVKPFLAPDKPAIALSKKAKPEPASGTFVKPGTPELDIRVHIASKAVLKSFEKPAFVMKALPEVPRGNVDVSTFRMPERNRPEIAVRVKTEVKAKPFQLFETNVTGLPHVRKPASEIHSFQPLTQPKLDLQRETVVLPSVAVRSFERLQDVKAELPDLPKVNVNIGGFTKPQGDKPKLNAGVKALKPIKNFKNPESIRLELPEVKMCKGFKMGTKAQDVLSTLKREVVS